ncbi:MAG: 3-oxoacyl-[acyl-carrier-protein] reductase [Nitrospirae bacterium]|nr:3-oxoacyl-[acyl-carrier-protein] reductase [Nitrospirota bacterium]
MKLKDNVALVTGSAQGIGKTIALALAREGANVVISDVSLEKAEETAKECAALGVKTLAVKFDVSKPDEVLAAFTKIVGEMGRLDILVNNAGITRDGLLMRMKDDDWDLVININLKGTFLCTKEAVKVMAKNRFGRIVSIASVVGFMGNAGQANYSASKAGIVGLTKTTAREYASRNITVNAVAPGFIQTAMTDVLPEKVKEEMMKGIPLGRLGSVDDVAAAVLFLVSPDAAYITGQTIHVNGGMYM